MLPVKKPDEIEKRRSGLEKYLKDLVQKTDVYSDHAFIDFMEIDTHKPDSAINQLKKLGHASHLLMGFRDIYFSPNRKYFFAACADPSSVSRVDSYITNMNMPWDKKDQKGQATLAVGALEAWGRTANEEGFTY